MKKQMIFALCAAMVFEVAACTNPANDLPAGQTPTTPIIVVEHTPDPTPIVGVEAVFGQPQVKILLISAASGYDDFISGFTSEAQALGIEVLTADSDLTGIGDRVSSANVDALAIIDINRSMDYFALDGLGIPVSVYTAQPGGVPSAYSNMSPAGSGNATTDLLEQALAYPPHDTPVRLTGVFSSESSPLAQLFNDYYKNGKILPKSIFYKQESKVDLDAFMAKFLENYFEGMVDGIVVETAELASRVISAMNAQGRNDMEVFCLEGVPKDVGIVTVIGSGPDLGQAGGAFLLCVANALKSGNTFNELLSEEDAELGFAAKYEQSWMRELREYYSK